MRYVFAAAALASVFALLGCGPSTSEVKGTVTMDGKPVDAATVIFTSDDGSSVATGFTDAQGNFTLSGANSKGVTPGTYSATVTKTGAVNEMTPGIGGPQGAGEGKMSADYVKQMEKNAAKKSGGPGSGPPKVGPQAGPPGGGPKTLLPQQYASPSTTPFKGIKVPTDGPVKLELTGAEAGGPPGGPGHGPPGPGGKK